MSILDDYFKQNTSYGTPTIKQVDTGQVTLRGNIPTLYQDKINRIIQVKGYFSTQEYITALCKEVPEIEDIIIPYEILQLIDEDYNTIYGGG